MGKLAPTSTKYLVRASIKANGVVEKPDVIGAIFGQTEGLLGADLNLRELQRTGRIGRIEVKVKTEKGNSEGEIIIPSSLTSAETALIAATLETIERVGPCTAEIKLLGVEDAMETKREYVISKAKDILQNLIEKNSPNTTEMSEQIKEAVRTHEISSYKGCPAGPDVEISDSIVVVEGRADVLNLLKYGIKNTVAIEGTSVPPVVAELTKEKETTILVDGDRGGDLIIKELMQVGEIDFIAKAPEGKEIEECGQKEVFKAIRDKITKAEYLSNKGKFIYKSAQAEEPEQPKAIAVDVTSKQKEFQQPERSFSRGRYVGKPETRYAEKRFDSPQITRVKPDQKKLFKKTIDELVGTRAACIFDSKGQLLGKIPVKELSNIMKTMEDPHTIIFDGKVDYEIDSVARRKGVKFLVGMEKDQIHSPVSILSRHDLE